MFLTMYFVGMLVVLGAVVGEFILPDTKNRRMSWYVYLVFILLSWITIGMLLNTICYLIVDKKCNRGN